MGGPTVAVAVFACLFLSAAAGVFAHARLPGGVLPARASGYLRGGLGMITLMAGLMLVLLTVTLKGNFDAASRDVLRFSAEITDLDHCLRRIGPDATPSRALLFRYAARTMKDLWPSTVPPLGPDDAQAGRLFDALESSVAALQSADPARMTIEADARTGLHALTQSRWSIEEHAGSDLSPWMVGVLLFWLMLAFASFGLAAPRGPTVLAILALGAVAIAGGMFLMVEYADAYQGVIVVSSLPMQDALFALAD